MSKIILQAYQKPIQLAVSDPLKLRALKVQIEKFMDKNHDVIFDQGPIKKLLFANTDKEIIYNFANIDPEAVSATLKSVESIKANWKLLNDPFIILSIYIIRELTIQKKIQERDMVIMYLSMKFYSGLFTKYFKYGVNEQIMNFTLNNLSDKYKYKMLKNNYAVIKDIVLNSHTVYEKILIKGDDEMLNTYFSQMFNRLNKVIRNIANEYYDNRDQKRYLNTIRSYDEETGNLLDYENSTAVIESLAESTTGAFMSSTINMHFTKLVAERNTIPYSTVFQTLTEIKKQENPKNINEMMKCIISVIYDADNSLIGRVCSTDFAVSAIKQLSISNSVNPNLIKLKEILDRLLLTYCSKYAMTQRLATKMSYRSAIYSYFVYLMISNKCK